MNVLVNKKQLSALRLEKLHNKTENVPLIKELFEIGPSDHFLRLVAAEGKKLLMWATDKTNPLTSQDHCESAS